MSLCFMKSINRFKTKCLFIPSYIDTNCSVIKMKQTMQCTSRCTFSNVTCQDRRTLRDVASFRKHQAQHSVLIELPSAHSSSQLCDLFSSCGQVKKIIGWTNFKDKNFSLVEFHDLSAVTSLLSKCTYRGVRNGLPVFSRFLYYKKEGKLSESKRDSLAEPLSQELNATNKCADNSDSFVSDQMNIIYESEKLKDIDTRLRFMMCTVLEDAFSGIFSNCRFIPVGSTVDGFGNQKSDLNLFFAVNPKPELGNSRFLHPTKKVLNPFINTDSHILSTVANILDTFLPSVSDLKKNMLSTPPLVKFRHQILGMNCTLTINNMPSLFVSELLYLYGELDSRVRPLVLTLKQWACSAKITQSYSGSGITNFALTLMVLFFLQTRPHPVLPPLDEIQHQDVTNNFKGQNNETIDCLLKEFFNFLCSFQFKNKLISVSNAQAFTKPDFSPLYIQNPVDQQLNLCKNVTQPQLDHLVEAANCSLWNLETLSQNTVIKNKNLLELLLLNTEKVISQKC